MITAGFPEARPKSIYEVQLPFIPDVFLWVSEEAQDLGGDREGH